MKNTFFGEVAYRIGKLIGKESWGTKEKEYDIYIITFTDIQKEIDSAYVPIVDLLVYIKNQSKENFSNFTQQVNDIDERVSSHIGILKHTLKQEKRLELKELKKRKQDIKDMHNLYQHAQEDWDNLAKKFGIAPMFMEKNNDKS